MHDKVLIVDFGSQVTQLIARRVREEKVYSEIVPYQKAADAFLAIKPKAVILSGGPASVLDPDAALREDIEGDNACLAGIDRQRVTVATHSPYSSQRSRKSGSRSKACLACSRTGSNRSVTSFRDGCIGGVASRLRSRSCVEPPMLPRVPEPSLVPSLDG
jgi:hypothetical protein